MTVRQIGEQKAGFAVSIYIGFNLVLFTLRSLKLLSLKANTWNTLGTEI